MSDGGLAKVLAFFRPKERAAPSGSLPFVQNWVSAVTREPFTGAWQRNLEGASTDSAVQNSGVFTCVSLISQDIAKLPANVMKPSPRGGGAAEIAKRHPIQRLFRTPNSYQTWFDLMQGMMSCLLLAGNAYLLKLRDARSVIESLHLLNPTSVRPLITGTGEVFYEINADVNQMLGRKGRIIAPASEIIHHRSLTLFHPLVGVTPLLAAGVSATMGSKIACNSSKFFENMSRASGVLTTDEKIQPEVAKLIKQMWEESFRGGEFGRTAVLGQGLKWNPLTINAQDAQLIEQLRWTIEDIARVFRVPGFLLGDTSKLTYRNSEQMQRIYYSGCLQPHIESLEARLTAGLELTGDQFVEIDLDSLLRTEMDVRYEAYSKGLSAGFLTINEVRAKEGLPPVEGGDKPHLQYQYVPLGTPPMGAGGPPPENAP